MKIKTVGWLLGVVWSSLGGILLVPLLLSLARDEPWQPFALTVAATVAGGAFLLITLRNAERSLDHRSTFLAVTLIGLSLCTLGAFPLALYQTPHFSLVDALFESTSGFTTTGATVLSGLDGMPHSLLLWRSIMQWLGGMGMVILGVAILPLLGVGGMQVYRAEAPGHTKDQMTPRIAETARLLWMLYPALTLATGILYFANGMTLFDAICHSMTTAATGGFSTHDASLGHFDSGSINLIATVAMIAGGTSFAVLYRALTGNLTWSEQPELRAYIGILALATLLITADLMIGMPQEFGSLPLALEHAAFQTASVLTTAGFATRNWEHWPVLSQVVLFVLFFVGGMAGSTSGGVKVLRIVLLARLALAQFFRLLHPRAVNLVRLGDRIIEDEILVSSLGFIGMWLLLLATGAFLLSLWGADFFDSLSTAAVTLGNIGPGFGAVGPSHTYAPFAPGAKLVMSALMFLGRLEIYVALIMLTPAFWRR